MVDLRIDTFKAKFTGGGARSNLYQVLMNFPSFVSGDQQLVSLNAKGAAFPPSTTTVIKVPYRGRELPVEGDRTYAPITLTFYNDVDHPIRDTFVEWKAKLSNHEGNTGLSDPSSYTVDFQVNQLTKDGTISSQYDIIGAFPTEVGEIQLGYDQANVIQEFPVIFEMLYWKKDGVTQ